MDERQPIKTAPLAGACFSGKVVNEWRSIETAPKDGTGILAFVGGEIYLLRWHERRAVWVLGNCSSPSLDYEEAPTHWMPPPYPPEG